MLPSEWREVREQRIRHALTAATQGVECTAEINGVPQREGGCDQGQAAGAMLLCLGGSVTQATQTMEADGAGSALQDSPLLSSRSATVHPPRRAYLISRAGLMRSSTA